MLRSALGRPRDCELDMSYRLIQHGHGEDNEEGPGGAWIYCCVKEAKPVTLG